MGPLSLLLLSLMLLGCAHPAPRPVAHPCAPVWYTVGGVVLDLRAVAAVWVEQAPAEASRRWALVIQWRNARVPYVTTMKYVHAPDAATVEVWYQALTTRLKTL